MLSNLEVEFEDVINKYLDHVIDQGKVLEFSEYLILLINFKDNPILEFTNDSLNSISKAIHIANQIESGYIDECEDLFVLNYLYRIYIALSDKFQNDNSIKVQKMVYRYIIFRVGLIVSNIDNYDRNYFFNIFPLLGLVIYLMKEMNHKNEKIVEYVVNCTRCKEFKQWSVPFFHVNNLNEDFNRSFPDGIIPLGMAHGSLKPLLSMSKLVSIGYKNENLLEGINNLFKLYEVFSKRENELLIWPNFITIDEYLNKSFETNIKQFRSAWCSGNLSTAYALFKVCKYMGWDEKSKYYYSEIIKILDQDLDDYNLELPIICHGYSFPLLVINNLIRNDYMNLGKDSIEMKVLYRKKQEILEILLNILNSAEPNEVIEKHFYSDYSIFYGVSGVLLSLQASMTNEISFIEELLLID